MKTIVNFEKEKVQIELDFFELDILRSALAIYQSELQDEESGTYYYLKDKDISKRQEKCYNMIEALESNEERVY
ncbi:hypothetical protein HYX07_02155 [Candidatus Woesearchaeota archaeon]|nr:hypothetical protein [Candidatus Woesearchaeota archaeon]